MTTTARRRRNPWLPQRPARTARARVFLVPYSGCGASMYRQWPRFRDDVEFVPVELPGHETRFAEPLVRTYEELAVLMVDGLREHLDVPFAFFGHCGSALAAYEASAHLHRSGLPTASNLFVSSEVAPQDGPAGRFLAMTRDELRTELEGLITELGGTAAPELVDLYLDVLCADVEVNKRYVVPVPTRLSSRITAIGWSEDDEIPFSTMGGWRSCGQTTSVLLPGRHHRFIEAPDDLLDVMVAGFATG